ncbi:hypothetical protein COT72_01625 [archaeon CG10_big_fil_rev_8_21_14_0_10_43_11]|nr:MAG: hypothetical protein COT72_01625 [archaeon CG10_big_fil_rev_8_21_14_0_10_43_11]
MLGSTIRVFQPWLVSFPFFPATLLFVVLLAFLIWAWALADVLRSHLRAEEKMLWFAIIIILSVLGVLAYVLLADRKKKRKRLFFWKNKPLYRSKKDRYLAGIAGGMAKRFKLDPLLVRILWLALTLVNPPAGIMGYVIAWAVLPEK